MNSLPDNSQETQEQAAQRISDASKEHLRLKNERKARQAQRSDYQLDQSDIAGIAWELYGCMADDPNGQSRYEALAKDCEGHVGIMQHICVIVMHFNAIDSSHRIWDVDGFDLYCLWGAIADCLWKHFDTMHAPEIAQHIADNYPASEAAFFTEGGAA